MSEVIWCGRAEGELADKIKRELKHQTAQLQAWLSEKLGGGDYFHGNKFGYADLCVAPYLNRSVYYGLSPDAGSSLQRWHARIKEVQAVQKTFEEMEAGAAVMATTMKKAFIDGPSKREYRDSRLEMMVKAGGIEVVLEGLRRDNIRFGWPPVQAAR
jgi:hypothetical protein